MIKIKICGITRPEDAKEIHRMGADFMGLVFAPSARRVSEAVAEKIIRSTPGFVNWVGVFVDETIEAVTRIGRRLGLPFVQLHGAESADDCRELALQGFEVIKALRVRDASTLKNAALYPCPFILLDSYSPINHGGTGQNFQWSYLGECSITQPVILSGGLNPDNIPSLLQRFTPYGVDVSSGVEERPGIKDLAKVEAFFKAIRLAVQRRSQNAGI